MQGSDFLVEYLTLLWPQWLDAGLQTVVYLAWFDQYAHQLAQLRYFE